MPAVRARWCTTRRCEDRESGERRPGLKVSQLQTAMDPRAVVTLILTQNAQVGCADGYRGVK